MERRTKRLFIVPLLTVLFLLALAVRPAGAHASLVQSVPEANARLDRAPVQIELFFSEPIEDSFSTIEVLDMEGNRVDNDDASVDPTDATRMSVTVRSLPDGIYTVSWKTLSSVDSHVTAGVFPIAIGDVDEEALAAAAQAGTTVNLNPGESLARWLTYAAAMALTGGTLFVLLIWQPAVRISGSGKALRPPWRRLSQAAIILLLGASFFWLLIQAGQASGKALAAIWEPAVPQVLFTTRFGALLLARAILALLLVPLLLAAGGRGRQWLALGVSGLLLLTISLGSHGAAEASPFLPTLADWIHLLMASFWLGGLIFFAAGVFSSRSLEAAERSRLAAVLIPRFTSLALISVSVLVLTGVYAATVHLTAWSDLTNTIYGQTLLVKLVIFLPMLALGAINFLNTSPRMKRAAAGEGDRALVSRFRRLVSSEALLGMAVLLSVGLLTTLPTPSDLQVAESVGGTQMADDLEVTLEIEPGRVGINTFTVIVTKDGVPLDDTRAVELRFTPTTSGLPPSDAQLSAEGNGRYSIEGAFFSMPDAYQVQAVVRRSDAFDAFANFDFSIGTTATVTPDFPWHQLTGVLTAVGGFALLLAVLPFLQKPAGRIVYAGVPAVLLAGLGLYVYFNNPAPQQDNFLANPIPPNAASIAEGEALYLENCLACHGATGLGDGPVGRTLNPPPADLTAHTAPGVHPDGRLYDWITNGFPDSVMPAFRDRLTDEQRWHLVNYIRTLSPEVEEPLAE